MESQKDKREKGLECEMFVAKLFHGKITKNDDFDIERDLQEN